jgi:hypothetical protein
VGIDPNHQPRARGNFRNYPDLLKESLQIDTAAPVTKNILKAGLRASNQDPLVNPLGSESAAGIALGP